MHKQTCDVKKLKASEMFEYRQKELEEEKKRKIQFKNKTDKYKETSKKPKKLSCRAIASSFEFLQRFPIWKNIDYHWMPHSVNYERQHLEFFKKFLYRYKISEVLIYTIISTDSYIISDPNLKNFSKKCLINLISGKSFYKANSDFFTKTEAHHFLNTFLTYKNPETLAEMIFEAKCKARKFNNKNKNLIVSTSLRKFSDWLFVPIVYDRYSKFLDFLERNQDYEWKKSEFEDFCDFIYHKITNRNEEFSFSGRTIASAINLANRWHIETINNSNNSENAEWERYPINDYKTTIEVNKNQKYIYKITQLTSSKDLIKEGRKMHHCVGSYIQKASQGRCTIFNVSRKDEFDVNFDSMATIEISNNRLVQARAKCNTSVDSISRKVINKFCRENSISIT